MKELKYIFILLTVLLIVSCEEDVVLDLGDIEKRLVVEAKVTNNEQLAEVALSYSQGFYDLPNFNRIRNASVKIVSADGLQSENLSLNEDDVFVSNTLQPEFGQEYTLNVVVDEVEVEVTTELPPLVEIQNVVFIPNPFFGTSDSLNAFVNVQDRKGEDNFFRLFISLAGDDVSEEFYVVDDTFGKDGTITMPIYYKNFTYGDTVVVELRHLNKATYDYYVGLTENLGGSFNSIAPGNPVSNMPDDVFGNFSGYSIDRDTIVIEALAQ